MERLGPNGFWCAIAALLLLGGNADAALTPAEYHATGVFLPPEAAVPLDVAVTDQQGSQRKISDLIDRTSVLVFADYTCTTLCGPIVEFVSAALEKSRVNPEKFRLLVVGLDPKDSVVDAMRMRRDHPSEAVNRAAFVTADAAVIARLTSALGYRYAYDAEHDQYVHPGAAYVIGAEGRVIRVLTGLGLTGDDMRLALVEAGQGRIGTFRDKVRLLCSGFDPAHGMYNLLVSRVLAASGIASILALGGFIGVLALSERRRRPT